MLNLRRSGRIFVCPARLLFINLPEHRCKEPHDILSANNSDYDTENSGINCIS